MNLRVSYDAKFDILYISAGAPCCDGASIADMFDVVAEIKTRDGYDVAGLIIQGAADYLYPPFVPSQGKPPAAAGDSPLSRYDPDTDTLTLGFTATDPELITQDNPYLVGYWQRDPEDADCFPLIGVSILNAAKHLAPHFVRVKPPAAG